jgi:hypothetical protein
MDRTILEDVWLRILYVVDGVGQRHYEPSGSLFRAGDEVRITRTTAGVAVEGYGMREEWRKLAEPEQEAA